MYLTQLTVREFRCIARTSIDLLHPDRPGAGSLELPNVNLLVGLNGGGKSTILKAIVLGLLGPLLEDSRFAPDGWVRRGAETHCEISVEFVRHLSDAPQFSSRDLSSATTGPAHHAMTRLERRRKAESLHAEEPSREDQAAMALGEGPAYFLAAYGPQRRVARADDATPADWAHYVKLRRVASLLDDDAVLVPLETWLPRLDAEGGARLEEVRALLDSLLPASTRFTSKMEENRYLFAHNEVAVPLGSLSEGVRSHIAWVGDLLHHLHVAAPEGSRLSDVPGVVLVDEVDHRMHPRWQLRVLSSLAGTLPRLQFVVTAHSPLLAGALRPDNTILLEPDREAPGHGATHARRLREDVFGRTADRVLTSSYFDLETSRADPFRAKLRTIIERARAGDPDAPIQFMQMLATGDVTGAAKKRRPLRRRERRRRGRKR